MISSPDSDGLSSTGAIVRRRDPERFLTALFAPADRREALFALYAFNFEIAKIRETVREPGLGQIRLQWWRDTLDGIYAGGKVRAHEVAVPLAEAISRHGLTRYHFDRLIDAREFDLGEDPPATKADLLDYAGDTSGRLAALAVEALGASEGAAADAALAVGTAWSLVGLLRAIPFHAAARRLYIPADVAVEADLHTHELFELRGSPELARVVERLAGEAASLLAGARDRRRDVPRAALPALLPARLADAHLARLKKVRFDVFHPAMATPDGLRSWRLAFAAWRGRW